MSAPSAEGALPEDEWERLKQPYLDKSSDAAKRPHGSSAIFITCSENGILSESEFNMKTWDVLSTMK